MRRGPASLCLLCRTAAPLGAGTRQPRWPDRFFQARGSRGGSARGPGSCSACPRGGGPESSAAPGAQLGAPGRGRRGGRARWKPERRLCKARQGATPAGHAPSPTGGAGAGSDTPAPRTRFKENSVGGEGGNKEKVKLGGGAAASFCSQTWASRRSEGAGRAQSWVLVPAIRDLARSPKGPVCSAPAGALPS